MVTRTVEVTVSGRAEHHVLDVVRPLGFTRADVRDWFAAGDVWVERDRRRRRVDKGTGLVPGDRLGWRQPPAIVPAEPDAPLIVAYASRDWIVVDKPAAQPCAPRRAGDRGTVVNALVARYPELEHVGYGAREPGLIHRLDNGTSGLLWVARSSEAFERASAALTSGAVDKRYLLLVASSSLPEDAGRIEAPVRTEGPKVVVAADGRPATTTFRVLRRGARFALVEAVASPAVRHQVRVHLASRGAPLLGDQRYGGSSWGQAGHALHAWRIRWAEAGLDVVSDSVGWPNVDDLARDDDGA
ncbi:MAG: RNA pseudouridine synthase [Myxococcota bacterium]